MPSWKLVTGIGSLILGVIIVALGVAYASTTIPAPDSKTQAQTTTVYFADGKTPIGNFAVQNRKSVPMSQIPLQMQHAMVSAEDRSFYTNSGVSPTAIVRAAWNNFQGGSTQGGSTITQQYVKNFTLDDDKTISRKAREFFIALKINRQQDKDEILNNYLNTIYFGRGAYGIEAASQAYFRVSAKDLSVSQSAFLAGIVKGPEFYDPADGDAKRDAAKGRWGYVLDGMVTEGWLSATDRAAQTFPDVKEQVSSASRAGYRGYLMNMVKNEAAARAGITSAQLETAGYKIVTTFDKKQMDEAMAAVKDTLPSKGIPAGTMVGMATIEPSSGAVQAIYGGADFMKRNRNAATQDFMQAGSTFKPFALIAALKEGISLKSRYTGKSGTVFPGFEGRPVQNFGKKSYGSNVDLVFATANSINSAYVDLNTRKGGAKATRDMAVAMGIPADTVDLAANPANVLGTASVRVIDMASAYATIANRGVYNKPYTITSIQRPDGKAGYTHAPNQGKRAFDKDVADDATYAMQQVVLRGSGTFAQSLGREVAGKTGTSSSNKSAWFVGFTPQKATAVGMYRDLDGTQAELEGFGAYKGREITGGSYPVRIWTAFMKDALKGTEEADFEPPVYGGEAINPAPKVTYTPKPDPTGTPTPTFSLPTPTDGPGVPTPAPSSTSVLGGILDGLPGRRTTNPTPGG